MEVNLAILIMAGGILSIVGLYSLGFRENRQSREDVYGAAFADAVLSPLVMAASDTNITWATFRNIPSYPSEDGWYEYLDESSGQVVKDPTPMAQKAFSDFLSKVGHGELSGKWAAALNSSGGLKPGLIIMHSENDAIVRIGFRASRNTGELLALPLYYTEVRFQGVQENQQ